METVTYPLEQYTEEEQARLAPHFTNLDRPVFALVNLPETVKGALFARYSRYAGTLRRLFLDEFADSLPEVTVVELGEGERAAKLYETIFLGYGDGPVGPVGGALLTGVSAWVDEKFPAAEGESPAAHRRAVKAKALDLVRGVLPAASLSHVGIYATGQTYEQLVLHLLAHPLAEARAYGEMLLEELQAVMPSFVT